MDAPSSSLAAFFRAVIRYRIAVALLYLPLARGPLSPLVANDRLETRRLGSPRSSETYAADPADEVTWATVVLQDVYRGLEPNT